MGKNETKKDTDFSYIAEMAEALVDSYRMDENAVLDILQNLKNEVNAGISDLGGEKSYWAVYAHNDGVEPPEVWIRLMREMSYEAAMECTLADDDLKRMDCELVRIDRQKYDDLMAIALWTDIANALRKLKYHLRNVQELGRADKMRELAERKVELLRTEYRLGPNCEIF